MAISYPYPIQHTSRSFGASTIWNLLEVEHGSLAGVGAFTELAPAQRAAGANMSVDVSAGNAFVRMVSPYGGTRFVQSSSVSNSITNASEWYAGFLAADASNPRVDRVVLRVKDHNVDSSSLYEAKFEVVPGTASAGATLTNLTGAATVPNGCLLLANVLIPASATTVTTANIDAAGDGFKNVRPLALANTPLCQLSRAATQSLATSGTAGDVSWDTEGSDLDGMWAVTDATHIYARSPGWYQITGHVNFAANPTGTRLVEVITEASVSVTKSAHPACTTDETSVPFSGVALLGTASNSRWVRVSAMQRSGAALNISSAFVTARRIRPA